MNNDLKTIICQHRRLSGLTQAQLATLAGVGRTVIFDIEHGKETVQLDTLTKVLTALNIRIELRSPVLDRNARMSTKETSA